MEGNFPVQYFLGANTAEGFYSVYDSLTHPEFSRKVWYIKGGPGNGKSTFMRRAAAAAESAGLHVEYILCSGDPDSLDGIYIREMKTAYVDATAPHVQEPSLPGVRGRYLDLSQFYRKNAVYDADNITALFKEYKAQYLRAYDLLAGARAADPIRIPGMLSSVDWDGLVENGLSFAAKNIPEGQGRYEQKRFISANTCLGFLSLPASALEYKDVYLLCCEPDVSSLWLSGVRQGCAVLGQKAILCLDPLDPEQLDGVIVPEAQTAFIKARKGVKYPLKTVKSIVPFKNDHMISVPEYKAAVSLRRVLLRQAVQCLAKAKQAHDQLEKLYIPAVDFKALDRFTEKHIRENLI